MLASLSGVVAATGKDFVVIQVGGVGFQVSVPQMVLDGLANSGPELTVYTHLHVRRTIWHYTALARRRNLLFSGCYWASRVLVRRWRCLFSHSCRSTGFRQPLLRRTW